MIIIYLGLLNWLITVLLVESEVFRPVREWVNNRFEATSYRYKEKLFDVPNVRDNGWKPVLWYKARYIVGCQLCTGVWVGWALALVTGAVVISSGPLGIILSGLLYKAVGHLVLVGQKFLEKHS